MSALELAWAAGFFDGEGCIFVRHTTRHKGGTTGKMYPLLTVETAIAQVRPEPLHRFHAAINVGRVSGPYTPKRTTHSPYYRWLTAGRPSVRTVLVTLWPYLSAPKREQAHRCWDDLRRLRTNKSPVLMELPV